MKIKPPIKLLQTIFIAVSITGCKHPQPEGPTQSFSKDVQPIIISNCTQSGCHGSINPSEFSLLTYEEVMNNGEVRPGNAHNSKLYEVITKIGSEESMPKDNPPLSESQIKIIYLWIEQGAENN